MLDKSQCTHMSLHWLLQISNFTRQKNLWNWCWTKVNVLTCDYIDFCLAHVTVLYKIYKNCAITFNLHEKLLHSVATIVVFNNDFYRHMWRYWCEVLNFTINFTLKVTDCLVVIINNVNPVRSDLTVWCFPCLVIVIHARKVFPIHSSSTREGKTFLAFMTMTLQGKHHTVRSSSQDCYNGVHTRLSSRTVPSREVPGRSRDGTGQDRT